MGGGLERIGLGFEEIRERYAFCRWVGEGLEKPEGTDGRTSFLRRTISSLREVG